MTEMGLCDDNIRNMINPYTATGTFGISWNGGYKPDDDLEYIRPFDNVVEKEEDELFVPPYTMPPNIFLKTQEARRYDILSGGEPPRVYEDRVCDDPYGKEDYVVKDLSTENDKYYKKSDDNEGGGYMNDLIILLLIIVLAAMFLRYISKK
jgi:hypothetical protein